MAQNPDRIQHQENYILCLKSTGIKTVVGRFKRKDIYCPRCDSMILKHEEKETDVAIAVKLLEVCFTNAADHVVILSGDTDLSPAIRICRERFPTKKAIFAFPYARKNKELAELAPGSFSINQIHTAPIT
ncbi:MAG: NYN domain-containing protein [Candidatus Omnitrophota bacterium]